MSQFDFGTIVAATKSGNGLAADLNAWRDALHSCHKGAARPAYAVAGTVWVDDSADPTWVMKLWTGTADIPMASYNTTTNKITPYWGSSLMGSIVTKNKEVLAKSAAYTVVVADDGKLIEADASGGAFTVTLPAAATAGDGFTIGIKKIDATTNGVTVDGNGAETLDGAATFIITTRYHCLWYRCDGTEWHLDGDAAAAGATFDVQVFPISGTWTKPGTGSTTIAFLWPGGGGGGKGGANVGADGGSGGGFKFGFFRTADLAATQAVGVGAGGLGGIVGGINPTAGGNTTFAGLIAYGGTEGGNDGVGGGGWDGPGNPGDSLGGPPQDGLIQPGTRLFGGGDGGGVLAGEAGQRSIFGGGGAGKSSLNTVNGGGSTFAGGGGGGGDNGSTGAGTGGPSICGGDGGAGGAVTANGSPGATPSGGGGGGGDGAGTAGNAGDGGDGGDGYAIIITL